MSKTKKQKYVPRREYNFGEMKVGDVKKIPVSSKDSIAGSRALTAAYAFARRANVGLGATSKKRVKFSGRISPTGKVMNIHRVQ